MSDLVTLLEDPSFQLLWPLVGQYAAQAEVYLGHALFWGALGRTALSAGHRAFTWLDLRDGRQDWKWPGYLADAAHAVDELLGRLVPVRSLIAKKAGKK